MESTNIYEESTQKLGIEGNYFSIIKVYKSGVMANT
jgi:hypothetical protein